MSLAELEKRVSHGEGQHLEFKKFLPEPEKLLREALAFANAAGGEILLGVDDDGTINGIKDPDEVEEIFSSVAAERCLPSLLYELKQIPLSKKRSVVSIFVPPGPRKPVLYREPVTGIMHCYYRIGDRSIQASRELNEVLKFSNAPRNVKIELGEKEKVLLEYLAVNGRITLSVFAEVAGISRTTASRTLVHLVKGSVLRIIPQEGEDFFERMETGD